MKYKGEERREVSEVYDRLADAGIKLIYRITIIAGTTIITLVSWIGLNIDAIKNDARARTTSIEVNKHDIGINRKDIIENRFLIGRNGERIDRMKDK